MKSNSIMSKAYLVSSEILKLQITFPDDALFYSCCRLDCLRHIKN